MSLADRPADAAALGSMIALIRTLRSPSGCPWDRQQTPRTIVNYLVEEVYELIDAIDRQKPTQVREELGDVLFQVLFIAEMYAETHSFDLEEVIRSNVAKMRRRHPHVFGESQDLSNEQIRQRWHEIKKQEKTAAGEDGSLMDSIPRQLPPLMRAYRICERVARSGVERRDLAEVLTDLEHNGRQFQRALSAEQTDRAMSQLGKILLTAVQAARIARMHPETALKKELDAFEGRFRKLEAMLSAEGKSLESCSQSDLQRRWENICSAEGREPGTG